jgi:TAP-like protein
VPSTPYASAQRAAKRLGNAVLLTHLGYGHMSYKDPSQCIEDARVAYLVDLETPPEGTVCKADQLPFPAVSATPQS